MTSWLKTFIRYIFDLSTFILVLITSPILYLGRKYGINNFPIQNLVIRKIGLFPIINHYYEPKFIYKNDFDFTQLRKIPLELDLDKQLLLLSQLSSSAELNAFHKNEPIQKGGFFVNNPNFGAGDVDLYYLIIREFKPRRIVEVGSGYSTMVCLNAIEQNQFEGTSTQLTCIEPFEMPFLNQEKNIALIRKPVEEVGLDLFQTLEDNDILFIDSSHIIRPGDDLLHIFFEILPMLKKGVIIHIHDIFSPRHYPKEWLTEKMRFWNEQYLLEAFLHNNHDYQVLFTANHLVKSHYDQTKKVLIHIQPNSEPSSFWMQKIN
jgi:predicted O-methyltransferase YrrM